LPAVAVVAALVSAADAAWNAHMPAANAVEKIILVLIVIFNLFQLRPNWR